MKDIVINFQWRAKSFRINGLSSEIQYIFDLDRMQDNKTMNLIYFMRIFVARKRKFV